MQVATNLPLYAADACRLFGRDAALWTLLAFNSALWFITSPDGLILPDTPLLLMLATGAWAVGEILFAPEITGGRASWLLARRRRGLRACGTVQIFGGVHRARADRVSGLFAGAAAPASRLEALPRRRRWRSPWFRPCWFGTPSTTGFPSPSSPSARLQGQVKIWRRPCFAERSSPRSVALLSPWIAAPAALGARQALRRHGRAGGQRASCSGSPRRRCAVRSAAADRQSVDPALVQFRLAVRLSARRRLARRRSGGLG